MGTGMVAKNIAPRIAELGHDVTLATRNKEETLSRPGNGNNPSFGDWYKDHTNLKLANLSELGDADMYVNATNGKGTMDFLNAIGAEKLKGKTLIDITNPLDFSNGMPPTLFVCNDDSLGEQIQRAFPEVNVVKSLNTLTAPLMLNPEKLNSDSTVFVSGNSEEAKKQVRSLLEQAGWKNNHIIDLGDITTARGTEQWLALWVRLYGHLQTPMFNLAIVK